MVKIRCSRCGMIIIDTEKKKCYATITWGATIRTSDVGFELEYDMEKSIMCMNCSHTVPIRKIKGKPWYKEVIELIERGDSSDKR